MSRIRPQLTHLRENIQNRLLARKLATLLQLYLFIDTDRLIHKIRRNRCQSIMFSLKRLSMVLFQMSHFGRFLYMELTYRDNPQTLFMMGDIYQSFGGQISIYFAASIAYASLQVCLSIYTWYAMSGSMSRKVIKKFLIPLQVIGGQMAPKSIGLDQNQLVTLRGQAKKVYYACVHAPLFLTMIFAIYIPSYYWFKYDLDQYWLNCLIAYPFWLYWVYLQIATHCVSLAYFYLLCLALKLRIQKFNHKLVNIGNNRLSISQTMKLIVEHYRVCEQISIYNRYWSKFLYASLQCFLPLTTLMIYIAFFPDCPPLLKIAFYNSILDFVVILSFTCCSAAAISCQLYKLHSPMVSLVHRTQMSWYSKWKLLNSMQVYGSTSTTLGFTCGPFFVLTYQSYLTVSVV